MLNARVPNYSCYHGRVLFVLGIKQTNHYASTTHRIENELTMCQLFPITGQMSFLILGQQVFGAMFTPVTSHQEGPRLRHASG